MEISKLKTMALCLGALLGGVISSRADGAFQVIANESVSAASLDKNALKDVYLGKTTFWEGGQAVTIVVVSDKTDAALQEVTGMSASQFKTHWQRLTFSGRGKQPKDADSVDKAVAMVAETKGAVALVLGDTAIKGCKKIEVK